MLDNEEMGRRIKEAIEGSDKNQAMVAAAFGITEQAVSGWIRTGKVDKRKLPKLAELTGRPLSYFLPGEQTDAEDVMASQLQRYDRAKMELAATSTQDWFEREGIEFIPRDDWDLVLGAYELLVSDSDANVVSLDKWLKQQATRRGLRDVRQREVGNARKTGVRADASSPKGGAKTKASDKPRRKSTK